MILLSLTTHAAEQLANAAWVLVTLYEAGRTDFPVDAATLSAIQDDLEEQLTQQFCTHCGMEPCEGRQAICPPCRAYRTKFGVLPSQQTLEKRSRRKVRRETQTSFTNSEGVIPPEDQP